MPIGQTSKGTGSSASSVATTGVSTSASGSTLVVLVGWSTGQTFSSIADTINGSASGNTWTQIGSQVTSDGTNPVRAYYCQNANGGNNHVVTITFSGATTATSLLLEATGVATASVLDGSSLVGNDSSSPFTSGNVLTTIADAILVGGIIGDSGVNPATHAISSASPTSGWTIHSAAEELAGNLAWAGCLASVTVSATGTYNSGFTESGANASAAFLVALKLASGLTGLRPDYTTHPKPKIRYRAQGLI